MSDNQDNASISGVERLNIALTPSVAEALAKLQDRTGRKKVDLVKSALLVLEFIDNEARSGREVFTQDPDDPKSEVTKLKLFF